MPLAEMPELREARARTRERLIADLRAVAGRADPPPEAVVLFGSVARGDFDGHADLDLLVIGDDTLPHGALAALGRSFDVVPMDRATWLRRAAKGDGFVTAIRDEGIVLTGRLPESDDTTCNGVKP